MILNRVLILLNIYKIRDILIKIWLSHLNKYVLTS